MSLLAFEYFFVMLKRAFELKKTKTGQCIDLIRFNTKGCHKQNMKIGIIIATITTNRKIEALSQKEHENRSNNCHYQQIILKIWNTKSSTLYPATSFLNFCCTNKHQLKVETINILQSQLALKIVGHILKIILEKMTRLHCLK